MTVSDLFAYRSLVERTICPHQVDVSLVGAHLRLLVDTPPLAAAIAGTFAAPAFRPPAGSRPLYALRVLTDCPDGWDLVLAWDGRASFVRWNPVFTRFDQQMVSWRTGLVEPAGHFSTRLLTEAGLSPDATLDLFAVVVERRLLEEALRRRRGIHLLHAGVLGAPAGAILLLGGSMLGKTTLTLTLAGQGLELFSDDYACVDAPTGRVHPFPTALRVRRQTLELVPGLALPNAAWITDVNGHDRACVQPADLCRVATVPQPLHAVFLLQGFESAPRLEPIAPAAALFEALRASNLPVRAPGPALLALAPLFSTARCFRLWQGSPAATAALVREVADA